MKIGTILKAINRHAAIYVCLAFFFCLCWLFHYLAFVKMEGYHRQFAVMNDRTLHAMALIDWVAANSWLAVVYAVFVIAAVAFAQFRQHPAWTCWLTALLLCIPCVVYWSPCVYIALKFAPMQFR